MFLAASPRLRNGIAPRVLGVRAYNSDYTLVTKLAQAPTTQGQPVASRDDYCRTTATSTPPDGLDGGRLAPRTRPPIVPWDDRRPARWGPCPLVVRPLRAPGFRPPW